MAGSEGFVILSEAKDHLAPLDLRKKILRFAQDDTWYGYGFFSRTGSAL